MDSTNPLTQKPRNAVPKSTWEIADEEKFANTTLAQDVLRLLEIFETTEESSNGRVFHPVTISSVRVRRSVELRTLLDALKNKAQRDEGIRHGQLNSKSD